MKPHVLIITKGRKSKYVENCANYKKIQPPYIHIPDSIREKVFTLY